MSQDLTEQPKHWSATGISQCYNKSQSSIALKKKKVKKKVKVSRILF